jgi:hypothetical protein
MDSRKLGTLVFLLAALGCVIGLIAVDKSDANKKAALKIHCLELKYKDIDEMTAADRNDLHTCESYRAEWRAEDEDRAAKAAAWAAEDKAEAKEKAAHGWEWEFPIQLRITVRPEPEAH